MSRLPETVRQAIGAQVTAADPGASVWVSANAGTGKTRVLINRIIRLLLAGAKPEQILCLTFTKAAAAEMANRLSERLGRWATMDDDALAADFRDYTGRPLETVDLPAARRLFAEVADTPEGLKIRTIHAFCESLLGRFPIEADVAPHFSVMDERTASELRREARDRVLVQAAEPGHEPLAKALDHIAGLVNEADFDALIATIDASRGKLARLLKAQGGPAGLAQATHEALSLPMGATREQIIEDGCSTADLDALRRAVAVLTTGTKTDQERGRLIQGWFDSGMKSDGFEAYTAAFLTQAGKARAKLMTKGIGDKHPDVLSLLEAEQQRVADIHNRLKALAIAENTQALVTVAAALLSVYEDLKEARAALDYDDLILKTRDLLSPPAGTTGAAAWVHYKLDGGLAHILVDEAQDTAPAQWQVIAHLAEEFFSGAGAWDRETDGPRTLFAVGDEKQSIYSFQGADPSAFAAMRDHFAEHAAAARETWNAVEMPLSFRSTWAVLGTVDKTFELEDARQGLSARGGPVRHLSFRDGDAGRVELWPVLVPEDEEIDDPWDAPLDRVARTSPLVGTAERIADTVAMWLEQGETLEAEGRPLAPGDVMILVRKRGDFVEEMVRALKQRNVPVAGTDRMVLTEQLAVMDLMAVGRFVLLPEDDLTLATVLKGPLFNFTDDDLFTLCHGRQGSVWHALACLAQDGSDPRWRAAHARLDAWRQSGRAAPPHDFYARLLGADGGRRQILARLGPDAADPLEEFLSLALHFEREHTPALQGFLHWMEAGRTEVKRDLETGGDQVRVMTVHGAKGLEAPVVFLPDTCTLAGQTRGPGLLWTDAAVLWPGRKDDDDPVCATLRAAAKAAQTEEERRLLYVALTRARDRLYITGWEGKQGRTAGCWYDLVEDALRRGGARETPIGPEGAWGTGLLLQDRQTAPVTPPPLSDAETVVPEAPWLHRLPAAEPTPPRPLAPTAPEEEPTAASPLLSVTGEVDNGNRFLRGVLIHRLLQSLPDVAPDARRAAAESYLKSAASSLDAEQHHALIEETLQVLDHPDFAPLFGPGSRAEVPLVGLVQNPSAENQGHVLSARIDRLLVTPDIVSIIDFKTNRPPPHRPEDIAPAYLRQMAVYRAAIANVYPGRRIDTFLLWTDGPLLMPLTENALAPYAR